MHKLVVEPWLCEDSPFLENEEQLSRILREAYPEVDKDDGFCLSAVIPADILQKRGDTGPANIFVDAWIESESLVVYVDTIEAYTDPLQLVHTQESDARLKQMGYNVVHIPFFIQMSPETTSHYFGRELDVQCRQPSGFYAENDQTPNPYVPARFCSMGWNKFMEDMYSAPHDTYIDVMHSLKQHSEKFGQELTTICFPLGLECKSCPMQKQQEDTKRLWQESWCGTKAGPQ